eukprot:15175126-Alexandrium_andersonii.AAC.1
MHTNLRNQVRGRPAPQAQWYKCKGIGTCLKRYVQISGIAPQFLALPSEPNKRPWRAAGGGGVGGWSGRQLG